MSGTTGDFSLTALHDALDAQRSARGLGWAAVAREMCERFPAVSTRAMSASTISSIGSKGTAEADGVLQMLLWLDRTPESFVPGHPLAAVAEAALPDPGDGHVLRVDTRALHQALDERRTTLGFTWAAVATETGVAAATLTGLAKGGRTNFPVVTRITTWLERPLANYTHATPW